MGFVVPLREKDTHHGSASFEGFQRWAQPASSQLSVRDDDYGLLPDDVLAGYSGQRAAARALSRPNG